MFLFKVPKWRRDIIRNIFHSLMNVPFTNFDDIIHSNAENITESLWHFASAMFINGCYWNDADKIRHDLEIE